MHSDNTSKPLAGAIDKAAAALKEQINQPLKPAPSRVEVAQYLTICGWNRYVAGNTDFEAAIDAIIKAVQYDRGILVSGEYGVGKTALIEALFPKNNHCRRVDLATDADFLDRETLEYNLGNPLRYSFFLDDLGAEPSVNRYGVRLNIVGDFIVWWGEHHEPGKRLFGTTNLNSEEFDAWYGGRVYSRIKNLCVPLRLTGKDKRQWV